LIRYLIDTNVVSELRKPKPYGAAVAWLQSLELGQGFFSAVTFGEIQRGVELTRQQIAATARVHGLTIATRNGRDFAHFDVAVLNPFR
jgi:predicted nucleic acid-binding protein